MYSYEDRMRAVKLYEQYGQHAAAVIRELGYPDRHMLEKWHREYVHSGDLKQKQSRKPKYSMEQRQAASGTGSPNNRNRPIRQGRRLRPPPLACQMQILHYLISPVETKPQRRSYFRWRTALQPAVACPAPGVSLGEASYTVVRRICQGERLLIVAVEVVGDAAQLGLVVRTAG